MKSILEERLIQLGWHGTASQLDDLVENASTQNVSYFDFLHTVVLQEWEHRSNGIIGGFYSGDSKEN
ncbi:MAG: hypothetical protein ACI4XL_12905 [Bacillus sp. (in: firmicutes)]